MGCERNMCEMNMKGSEENIETREGRVKKEDRYREREEDTEETQEGKIREMRQQGEKGESSE